MSKQAEAWALSPELRASIYHFTVFASTGAASVYFGIWLSRRGISPDETGIINAMPVLLMLLLNTLIGRIADRASDWKQAIVVLSLIAGVAPVGMFFVSDFWGVLAVWTLCMVPASSVVPVVDAATLRMTQRRGTSFSFVRGWGTVGYTVTTAVAGPLIGFFGEAAFVPLFLGFAICRALASLQLPRFRAGPGEVLPAATQLRPGRLRDVLKLWFVLPIFGFGVVYASNSPLGSFAGLLWKGQGIDETAIGLLIALSAAAEAVMLFAWRRLNLKVSARHLIILAALVAVIRWGLMALNPPLWALALLQLLHAFTFAMGYLGGIYFIANWTSEDIAAEAQGFSSVVQQGMTVIVLLGFGVSVSAFGSGAWLVLSAFCLLGVILPLISLRLQPKHD